MVEKAFDANKEGAGVAWREEGCVRWKKGLELDEVKQLCQTLPIPYVAHFRIASTGGKRRSLCHPFPIEHNVSLSLEGKTNGNVLFHNGHWGKWKETVLEATLKMSTAKIPTGKWSDTRAIAWMVSHYGLGILEFIDEKCCVFGVKELEVFGGPWHPYEDGNIWASNKSFDTKTNYGSYYDEMWHQSMCRDRRCVRKDLDKDGWCPEHAPKKEAKSDKVIDIPKVMSEAGAAAGSSGGDPTATPFVKLLRAFKDGKISRKQFKKAKKALDEGRIAHVLTDLSMKEMAIVVKH